MAQTEQPPRIRIGCCLASCNGDVWGPRSLHEDFDLLAEVEYMLGTMFGNVEESVLTLYLPSEASFQSARKMTDTFIILEVDQSVLAGRPSGSRSYNLGHFLQGSDSLRILHRYKDGKRLVCVFYDAMDACHEATCYLRHLAQLISISNTQQCSRSSTVFGRQMRFNVRHSIPLVTTRCMDWRSILEDLLCCVSGDDGRPGSDGMQWRCFCGEMDQLAYAEVLLKHDPYNRSIIISTWNPCDPDAMASPSSQVSIQFYVHSMSSHCDHIDQSSSSSMDGRFEGHNDDDLLLATDGDGEQVEEGGTSTTNTHTTQTAPSTSPGPNTHDKGERLLSCHVYQRSIDVFASLPQCISSCAMLTHIMAKRCGMLPHEVIVSTGDMHLKSDHLAKARLQLRRVPRPSPCFHVSDAVAFKEWHELSPEDFDVCGYYYSSHPDLMFDV